MVYLHFECLNFLGFIDNQYRKYEEGEMPSVSNGKMISALKDPHFFWKF